MTPVKWRNIESQNPEVSKICIFQAYSQYTHRQAHNKVDKNISTLDKNQLQQLYRWILQRVLYCDRQFTLDIDTQQ